MIQVSIVGAGGYTGLLLLRLLLKHPCAQIAHLAVRSGVGLSYSHIYPSVAHLCDRPCSSIEDVDAIVHDSDVIFFSLPHGVTMNVLPQFLSKKNLLIIDLSGDYRLKDHTIYSQFYGRQHKSPDLIKDFVYGLSELFAKDIAVSQKISNPGCFPTAFQLGIAPLLRRRMIEKNSIFVDAKSGLSGAGKVLKKDLHFVEANENLKAYKAGVHQHQPEMEQISSHIAQEKDLSILFVPHLVPMNRGIYSTTHLRLKEDMSEECLFEIFKEDYQKKPFIRILSPSSYPEIKDVIGTNFCDVSFVKKNKDVLIFAAIDNLMKGASSQAIQNMNIALSFKETEGLL